jgi:hypothetical protein
VLFASEPPGATVYVDDVAKGPIGTTPWAGTLSGTHTVLFAKPGYFKLEHKADFTPQRVVVQHVVLSPSQ